mmetsp:Transcript_3847/g.11462  ORF Transcript_3847/g.11462 Transcript_3847/m.11462 type:complete len:166 (+) Transcript_3847:689-1186(+)
MLRLGLRRLIPHQAGRVHLSRTLSSGTVVRDDASRGFVAKALDITAAGLEDLQSYVSLPLGGDWWLTLPLAAALLRTSTFLQTRRYIWHRQKYQQVLAEANTMEALLKSTGDQRLADEAVHRKLRADMLQKAGTSALNQVPLHLPIHMTIFASVAITVRRFAFTR